MTLVECVIMEQEHLPTAPCVNAGALHPSGAKRHR